MSRSDLIVIGGGWGGYSAAMTAAQRGRRVALVEGDKVGGVCLHRGCIPTKVLLETAARFRLVTESAALGVRAEGARLDWDVTLAHRDDVVERLHTGMRDAVKLAGVELITGWGRVAEAGVVEVERHEGESDRLEADAVIVATGSAAGTLPFLPLDGKRVVTSDEALDLAPPGRAVVIGAGSVGLEFASLWADLGSDVTVLEALPRILPQEDEESVGGLAAALTARGIGIVTEARIDPDSVRITQRSVAFRYEAPGSGGDLKADVALVAVGRAPRLPDGLEALGVEVVDGALVTDAQLRTSVPNLYAVGDVTGGLQLAHVAAAQGRFVAQRLCGDDPPVLDRRRMPRVVYTRPQLSAVGLTESEARDAGYAVQVGRAPFSRSGRALIAGEPDGLVKLMADVATGDVLGVHIVGAEASELIGQAALAAFLDASVWELATSVQPHPTLSEALAEAAQVIVRRSLGKEATHGESQAAGRRQED